MDNYQKVIKKMISEKAGVELVEVTGESFLEDDLNLGELEITELLQEVEETFELDLSEYKDTIETVDDLLGAVAECLE